MIIKFTGCFSYRYILVPVILIYTIHPELIRCYVWIRTERMVFKLSWNKDSYNFIRGKKKHNAGNTSAIHCLSQRTLSIHETKTDGKTRSQVKRIPSKNAFILRVPYFGKFCKVIFTKSPKHSTEISVFFSFSFRKLKSWNHPLIVFLTVPNISPIF